MLSPFTFNGEVLGSSFTATIERTEHYVEHVVKKRSAGSGDVLVVQEEVAKLTWRLIEQADKLYKTIPWIQCAYDLATVRRVLEGLQHTSSD